MHENAFRDEASGRAAGRRVEENLRPLGGSEIERVLAHLELATFRWTAADDRLVWSDAAGSLFGLPASDLPINLRAFHRLLTPDSAGIRAGTFAMLEDGLAVGPEGVPYSLVLQLRPSAAGAPGPWLREIGRWWPGPDGAPDVIEGYVVTAERAAAGTGPDGHVEISPITGLVQRDGLLARLRACLADMAQARQGSAAFLVIAVNDLASINANFGFDVGDRIIATVAERISRRMRQGDVIGHMSGHKFGAVLYNCSESALAVAAARFQSAINDELVVTPEAEVQVAISMGAVIVPRHARDAETAAVRAEEALHDSRGLGGSLFVYQPSPERDHLRRLNLSRADEVAKGLAEDRFVLAYQPVVEATTGRIVSYEALTRLIDGQGRVVSAGPLVATAERLGLVRRIDLRALRLVLADLRENRTLRIAVNASKETLSDPVWIGHLVDQVSADREIAPRLTVEITETAAMRNADEVRRMAETLRDIGCRVALDDFGAGYTAFRTLRDLELDVLKIDGLYICDIVDNPDSAVFVRALVDIARHFGIRTVAEWVQDEASARLLAGLGVDYLQGRHVGEPLLRASTLSRPVLDRFATIRSDRDEDGYQAVGGRLDGPIDMAGAEPTRLITFPERAGPAVAAWPRAAS